MISANKANGTINKEIQTSSKLFINLKVGRMIKAAKDLGQNQLVLTYMTNDLMDSLYNKGYRVYKIHGNIRGLDCREENVEHVERIPLYVVQWKHAK